MATLLRGTGATGVETHIKEVAACSARRGEAVSLVTPFSWMAPMAVPLFGVRRAIDRVSGEASVAWYRYWHYRFLRQALSRRLADDPEAVVYAHCPVSAAAALEARRWPSQRVSMAVHFDTSQADEWVDTRRITGGGKVYAAIRRLETRVLPALDGIVYVSCSVQRALVAWLPAVEKVPSIVVPNFLRASEPGAPLPAPRPDLVSVGGLEPAKNQVFLLEVLAEASRLGHRYCLDIVGEGPCRKQLCDLIETLGLKEQVRLLGYQSDVRTLLPRYRAYVHGSTREAMPLAPIEALAAGLPVVAVPVGGLPEVIDPGVEGLFWSPTDPCGAARLLIGLLEDEGARARMSAAARVRFERELAADVVGPRLLDFLFATPARALSAESPGPGMRLTG